MPRHGRASSAPLQRKTAVEQGSRACDAIRIDAARRELDGQRNAVEAPADARDERGLFRAELERTRALGNALDEELGRGVGEDLGDTQVFPFRRTIQREQPEDPLAFAPERLAAGRENTKLRRFANDALDERGPGCPARVRSCRRSAGPGRP
ncbi:hypothetical protein ACVWW6_003980 [Bradyrhizobium sp. USDA 3311]